MREKVVMVGERRYRLPFIDLIPFDEDQNKELGKAVKESGKVLVPVVCWKEKKTSSEDTVIDGAHRVMWASEHDLPTVPKVYRSFDDEDEAKAECERLNLDRRHLTAKQQGELRIQRVERVAEMRRQGASQRAIAEAEGISTTQVQADLQTATAQGCAVEPPNGQITGKDGKKRSATMKLCPRCARAKRVGQSPVANCEACAKLRRKQGGGGGSPGRRRSTHDHFGNVVPNKLLDAWGDPFIQTAFDYLARMGENFRAKRFADQMSKKGKHYPFFDAKDFIDGCGFISQYIDQLVQHLKDNRPAGVCPACKGEKCSKCRMGGLVPRALYATLKEKHGS